MMNLRITERLPSLGRRKQELPAGFGYSEGGSAFRQWRRVLAGSAALAMGGGAAVYLMMAATVTNRTDSLSNQGVGAKSQHRISFNLPSGQGFAVGKSIVVRLPEGFGLGGSWTTGDFTFNDGTVRTVAAVAAGAGVSVVPACGQANAIGVAIDTTTRDFRFSPCHPTYTASAPGAMVTLLIDGEGPNGLLTNPTTAGSYLFEFRDVAGQCTGGGPDCQFPVAIVANPTISVTARVGGCGNGTIDSGEQCDDGNIVNGDGCNSECRNEGGTGGGSSCVAVGAPTVSDLTVSGATVNWTSTLPGDSLVRYGLDATYGQTAGSTTMTTTHAQALTGLTEGATYHYQACTTDALNCQACSSDQTFATGDETPPAISGITCTPTDNTLTIGWTTSEAATQYVDWATTAGPPYASSTGAAAPLGTAHSVTLTGLAQGTAYHYRTRSADATGNEAISADATCRTTAPVPAECTASCPTVSYDLYIVNPDGTERHSNTAWVRQTTVGTVTTFDFEDKSITPGDPLFDYNDVVLQMDTGDCNALRMTVLENEANWSHSVRIKVKVGGVEKSDTLISDDSKVAVDTVMVVNAHALISPLCPLPPAIYNIKVTPVTTTTAVISWTTSKLATTWADFGTAVGAPYPQSAGTDAPLATAHNVTLTGLTQGTTYHYRLRGADDSGRTAATGDLTFQTAETIPPVISNVQVTGVTATTATVTWTTDENADSVVLYGPTPAYGQTASAAALVTTHSMALTGLTPNTAYSFTVTSRDRWGNLGTAPAFSFTTPKPPVPVITNVRVEMITEESARVLWDTTTAADSRADYGLTTAYGATKANASLGTAHSLPLTGLAQGTTYNFRVTSVDAYGQSASSANATFTTLADAVPPGNVIGLTATGGNAVVTLNWTNPGDADFAGVRLVRSTTAFPTSPTNGLTVFTGNAATYLDTNVSNNIQYFYAAFAYDEVPNYASGAVASATPHGATDHTAPSPVAGLTAVAGDARVQLSWTNPTDPDFAGTRLVRKEVSCPANPNDGTVVYEGTANSRLDTDVANGVRYCYAAFTRDGVPNWSAAVTATATPTAAPNGAAPSPVTGVTVTPGDGLLVVSWTNPTDADRAGTRVLRKLNGYPTGPTDGTLVYDGAANTFVDRGLTNGTAYYYALYAYDTAGNLAKAATGQGTPSSSSSGVTGPACIDTDGGLSYDVKGTVTLADGKVDTDSCADGHVKEYYCTADGKSKLDVHDCGDGYRCSDGRCVPDTYTPVISQCGNGTCEGNENSLNCAADCPVVPEAPPVHVKPPTVPEGQRLHVESVVFVATSADIPLRVRYQYRTAAGGTTEQLLSKLMLPASALAAQVWADAGELQVYSRMAFTVVLPRERWVTAPSSAYVNLAGASYTMKLTDRGYEAVVVAADGLGVNPLTVVVNYPDKTNEYIPIVVRTVTRPVVTGEVKDDQDRPLKGVRVSLFMKMGSTFGLWDSRTSGQANPQMTDDNGRYSFVVPVGEYYLRADKDGYRSKETLSFTNNYENVITTNLQMLLLPPKLEEAVKAAASGDVGKAAAVVAEQAGFAAKVAAGAVAEAAQNEGVQAAAAGVVAPTITAIAVANVATAASALPYLNSLLSLLAHPLLLIARRKRRRWGVVYDALNKLPIDLAIVRLIDANTNRIIRSAVTDKDGRYFFIVGKGQYRLSAVKPGFLFPTQYLRHLKEDAEYVDLYHGEPISVTEETSITANIPLDPMKVEKTPVRVTLEGAGRRLQKLLGVVTLAVMVVVFAIKPSVSMGCVLAANFVFFFLFNRLAMPRKPKNWGVVYDEKTRKPLSNVVVRIFESKYNKLLETQVTDIRGRYAFLVGSNVYYVTYEKPGYMKAQKGPVDFVRKEAVVAGKPAAKVVAVDIRLKPQTASEVPPPVPPAEPKPEPKSEAPAPAPAAPPTAPSAPNQGQLAQIEFIRNLARKRLSARAATPPKSQMTGISCPEVPLLEDASAAHPDVLGLPAKADEDGTKK